MATGDSTGQQLYNHTHKNKKIIINNKTQQSENDLMEHITGTRRKEREGTRENVIEEMMKTITYFSLTLS